VSDGESPTASARIRLTLFVAPNSQASVLAAEHLQRALERCDAPAFDLEIVDVFTDSQRLLSDGVLVTPTLLAKELGQRVVGDLSNASLLEYFLESLLKRRSAQT
jgi:hypothetical protein